MVTLQAVDKPSIQNYWLAIFTPEELSEKRCAITKEMFEVGERILMCGGCGVLFKKRENVRLQNYFCSCSRRQDVRYYHCRVEVT